MLIKGLLLWLTKGPSINNVGYWEVKGVKIADRGEGGVKNLEKLSTSFMGALMEKSLTNMFVS